MHYVSDEVCALAEEAAKQIKEKETMSEFSRYAQEMEDRKPRAYCQVCSAECGPIDTKNIVRIGVDLGMSTEQLFAQLCFRCYARGILWAAREAEMAEACRRADPPTISGGCGGATADRGGAVVTVNPKLLTQLPAKS